MTPSNIAKILAGDKSHVHIDFTALQFCVFLAAIFLTDLKVSICPLFLLF